MTALGFTAYLIVLGIIALLAWRRTRSMADYLLGGRRVGAVAAALSAGASDMSGWLLLGLPGLALLSPASAAWTAIGLLLGTWANWRLLAAPLRRSSEALGALTLPSYFALRFPAQGTVLRVLTAGTIVVFFLLYTSAGLVAGAKLFETVFDLPYFTGVFTGAAIIVAYTAFGGFLAVTWTDVFQALLMLATLVAVAVLLVGGQAGDPGSAADGEIATLPGTVNHGLGLAPIAAVSALAWGLGYFGQPHILARFMALDDEKHASGARRIGVVWTALGLTCAVVIGAHGVGLVGASGDPERVFILAVEAVFQPWVAGICLAAILAAIMSTADSQLLVTAAALAEDLWPVGRHTDVVPAVARVKRGRYAVVLVAGAATGLALDPAAAVFDIVARAWAGFGATLGPALLIACHDSRASGRGAVGGMIAGALTVWLWPGLPDDGFGLYELLPGFVVAIIVNVVMNRSVKGA